MYWIETVLGPNLTILEYSSAKLSCYIVKLSDGYEWDVSFLDDKFIDGGWVADLETAQRLAEVCIAKYDSNY